MTTLDAVNLLASLTGAIMRSAESAQRISAIVQAAQSENRAFTDAEVAEIQNARRAAVERWKQQ